MGVYIPSLKMPQTCEDCVLESYCSLWVEARRMSGPWEKGVEATIRHPDCPLVEVKPHGRLIDADALAHELEFDIELDRRVLDQMDFVGKERALIEFGKDCKQILYCMRYLSEASTVIPAEEVADEQN